MKCCISILLALSLLSSHAQIIRGSGSSTLTAYMVNVKEFGAIGDGNSHPLSSRYSTLSQAQAVYPTAVSLTEEIDGLAIQTAANFIVYGSAAGGSYATGKTAVSRNVWVPDGKYLCSSTINLGYGDQYTSVNLIGEKYITYNTNLASVMRGARLVPTFKDRPLINIQGVRDALIDGIQMVGLNNVNPGYAIGMLQLSNYIDPSLPRSASARYSPYCAISVDAYSANKPTDTTGGMVPYPDLVFPPGASNTTQWNKNRSSGVTIRNCKIMNFVVGFVTEPCGGDNNGDFTFLEDDQISNCAYGVSITHSQARLGSMLRCQIDAVYTCIEGMAFGSAHGRFVSAQNCHFSGYQILNIQNTDYNGPTQFRDCYAESLHKIGFFGIDRSSSSVLSFENCNFKFNHPDIQTIPNYLLEIDSKTGVSFKNCNLTTAPTTIINSGACPVRFENTKFIMYVGMYQSIGLTNTQAFGEFLSMTGGIVAVKGHKSMKGCAVSCIDLLNGWSIAGQIPDGVGGDNWDSYADPIKLAAGTSNIPLDNPMPSNGYIYSSGLYPSPSHGNIDPATLKIPVTVINANGSKATYPIESGYTITAWDGRIYLFTGSNTSTNNYTDTATLLNGFTLSAGVVSSFQVDTTQANLFPGQANYMYCRFNRGPTYNALTATATSGTNQLTNIQFHGANATQTQIDGAINAYYMVYMYQVSSADPGSRTSGMYGPFRVTAVDETNRTITFDRNVPFSGTVHFFNTGSY